jgi:hypothetical protein
MLEARRAGRLEKKVPEAASSGVLTPLTRILGHKREGFLVFRLSRGFASNGADDVAGKMSLATCSGKGRLLGEFFKKIRKVIGSKTGRGPFSC